VCGHILNWERGSLVCAPRTLPQLYLTVSVLNPGTVADRRLIAHADQTVISEERFETYVDRHLAKSFLGLSNRDSLACIMHSIPPNVIMEKLKPMICTLKEVVGTLFLTDLSVEYYHSLSPRFAEFVDIILDNA
jgi:hypothetical protein